MAIKDVLGFSLKPVKVDPDGFSAPPDPASLAPPSAAPDSVPAESELRASVPPDEENPSSDAPLAHSLAPGTGDAELDADEMPATQPRRQWPAALLVSIPPEPLIVSAPPPPLFASLSPERPRVSQPPSGAEAAEALLASLAPPAPSEPPPPSESPSSPPTSLPPGAESEHGAAASLPPEALFVSLPPAPLILSARPHSDSMPPALSLPPSRSLPPRDMGLDVRDGSAFLSLPPSDGYDAPVSVPPEGAYDASSASIPPESSGGGLSLLPEPHADSARSGDEEHGHWSSSRMDPELAGAAPHDLFATRVEGLGTPKPPTAHTEDDPSASPHESAAPGPHPSSDTEEQLLAAAGVRPRIDLRSGLLLGFAAFTSVMSAACFVILLLRSGPTQPAAATEHEPAAQSGLGGAAGEEKASADEGGKHEAKLGASQDEAHGEATKQRATGDEHAGEGAKHEAAAVATEHGADDEPGHGPSNEKAEHTAHDAPPENAHGAEHEPPRAAAPGFADAHDAELKTTLPSAELARGAACRMVRPPRRLVRDVSPRVPLEARVTRDGDVLLGYVMAKGAFRAVKLQGSTQRVREQRSEQRLEEVTGIVPLGDANDAEFAVDHPADDERSAWRTLPGPGEFALSKSRTNQVFLLAPTSKRPTLLWSLPPGSPPTRPVVTPAGPRRYALAFRDGEPSSGQVRFGWLDLAGGAPGKLETLPLGAVEVGAPALAVRNDEILIAVALRDREEATWRVELWRAGSRHPARVVLPALQQGEIGDQIAPRLSPLDGERWALQWTTGKAGKRHVDLLVLDAALRAIGEPLMVSGVRSNGGGGLLISNPPLLLSFYLVQSAPEDYDLWLRVLDC